MKMIDPNKKKVAWGCSKLLELYLDNSSEKKSFEFIVDSNTSLHGKKVKGLEVKSPKEIFDNSTKETVVIIFAVSNLAIQSILKELNHYGFILGNNVFLYSDLFFDSYEKKTENIFKTKADKKLYSFIKAFALSSNMPIHTTFLGNLLFLELLVNLEKKKSKFAVAEVGAYCGGNALIALSFLSQRETLPYYIFDSFAGFPVLSEFDPKSLKKGDYTVERSFENIQDIFSSYNNAYIIKGFVPESFNQLNPKEKYGLVFYDCDLYQPALDTFDYFWDKIIPGGYLLIHDYYTEEGGFTGVKKAVDEYFTDKKVTIHGFWENTMALIIKNDPN